MHPSHSLRRSFVAFALSLVTLLASAVAVAADGGTIFPH
jgi:hypothetical protein